MVRGKKSNPEKTTDIVFTRKYKPETVRPLRLWGQDISYANVVKYLGVHLDNKLSWKLHFEEKRKKLHISMWACKRAMWKNWGLNPKTALWLYRSVLLPKFTYAVIVWWPRMELTEARNLARSLQGGYLMAMVGAKRTTPTEALEVALSTPPLDLKIKHTAEITADRLWYQGEWKGNGLGHTRLSFFQNPPFTLKQDRISKKFILGKMAKTRLPAREEWNDPDSLLKSYSEI